MKGNHFLKLLDFTPDQINYLLDLSADFKAKKKAVSPTGFARASPLPWYSKRPAPAPAALSK